MVDQSPVKNPKKETIDAFMQRMWNQDLKTLSEDDYRGLLILAVEGAGALIKQEGINALMPSSS